MQERTAMSLRRVDGDEGKTERSDHDSERIILTARRVVRLSHKINTELDTELEIDCDHSDCVHFVDLSDCGSDSISDSLVVFTDSSSNFAISDIMAEEQENRPTLKELVAPDLAVTQIVQSSPPQHGYSCGFCSDPYHSTDSCPTLYDPTYQDQSVAAVGVFPGKPQYQQNNAFSNTYNPGWRNHLNFRWNQNHNQTPPPRPAICAPPQGAQQQASSSSGGGGSSLEDMMKQFVTSNMQFQQQTDTSIQSLQTQIGQLATSLNQLQPQENNTLPSQTIPNPKGNVCAISLRSGKQLEEPKPAADVTSTSERESETVKIDSKNKKAMQQGEEEDIHIPLPFPQKEIQSKRLAEKAQEKDILETFKRVEINIPFLDAVKQIPKYAKFLKELCTNKRRRRGMNEFDDCVLDLGASINVMPASVYKSLGLGPLRPTGVIVQLANRSSAHPSGLVEDVLVKVNDLIFPADFYILDMEDESPSSRSPIILGRSFMKTARTKIDVHSGTLSMEFGDISVNCNIFDAMKHPREEHSVFCIDVIDDAVDDVLTDLCADYPDFASVSDYPICACDDNEWCSVCTNLVKTALFVDSDLLSDSAFLVDSDVDSEFELHPDPDVHPDSDFDELASDFDKLNSDANIELYSHSSSSPSLNVVSGISSVMASELLQQPPNIFPSIEQPPKLELKSLPDHLKYAFLEVNEQLPIIVANNLLPNQEEKLQSLLRANKKAIGWTLADIVGISPSMCMHRILLEEDSKPVRQPQRRLNPLILDVVKKEVTKLLQAGIIYLISDSQWVSPVQVVPKKSGVTVVANQKNELIPTRVQNSWRVCIHYRRLNQATHKDHYPLPFIDQMLERLAGKSHYCFLDGYSGYF
ncbi:hypothetical protein K1719_037064 [Acacia pycnantha]|nr:hypothetical protein K1719_037064 [Acacia pycnantha]